MTDTQGFLLDVIVHPADIPDRDGGQALITPQFQADFPTVQSVIGDRGYRGKFVKHVKDNCPGLRVEIIEHADAGRATVWVKDGQTSPTRKKGFRLLRLRWVVERTFAWLGLNRRLSKDYEATVESAECWIWMAMARVLLRRLAG